MNEECTTNDYCIDVDAECKRGRFRAVVLISSNGAWYRVSSNPDGIWPAGNMRHGLWQKDGLYSYFYPYGFKPDEIIKREDRTENCVFYMAGAEFPPSLIEDIPYIFGTHFDDYNENGRWTPVIAGRLMVAAQNEAERMKNQMYELLQQLGLSAAEAVDPTGIVSVGGAVICLRQGDIWGAVEDLLGVIPLFGTTLEVYRLASKVNKIEELRRNLTNLKRLLERSNRLAELNKLRNQVVRRPANILQDVRARRAEALAKGGKGSAKAAKQVTFATDAAEVGRLAEQGGMTLRDAKAAQQFCAGGKHKRFMIVRQSATDSLPHHFEELAQGKEEWMKAFHAASNAKSKYKGWIVVKKEDFHEAYYKWDPVSRKHYFPNRPGYYLSDPCPITGDRMILKDGKGFFSDYDMMGVYEADGSFLKWAEVLADDVNVTARFQQLFKGFANKVQHGMQDFFFKFKKINGQYVKVMGRQPELNEKFMVFSPDGRVEILNLGELKAFYKRNNIPWNYDF